MAVVLCMFLLGLGFFIGFMASMYARFNAFGLCPFTAVAILKKLPEDLRKQVINAHSKGSGLNGRPCA